MRAHGSSMGIVQYFSLKDQNSPIPSTQAAKIDSDQTDLYKIVGVGVALRSIKDKEKCLMVS